MQATTIQHIWTLVEPIAVEEGLEIVDIEFQREGRGTCLRIFLDSQGGGGGVDLEALARVSRQVGDVLEVHEAIAGPYTLETSSPGVNRRLRVPEHFRRYLGQRVRVRTTTPIDGRRTFLGTLQAVQIDGVVIAADGREDFVAFAAMAHANYEYDFVADRAQGRGGVRRHNATGTHSGH